MLLELGSSSDVDSHINQSNTLFVHTYVYMHASNVGNRGKNLLKKKTILPFYSLESVLSLNKIC